MIQVLDEVKNYMPSKTVESITIVVRILRQNKYYMTKYIIPCC